MFNFKQLKLKTEEELAGNILKVSDALNVAPVMVIRRILRLKGLSKRAIKEIIGGKKAPPEYLKESLEIALRNDPVFSPIGIKYSKKRGKIGEDLIAVWLDSLSIRYDRDLGQGGPDFLLGTPIRIDISGTIKEFDWIESKASYGDAFEMKRNRKQFGKYEILGNGLIFYWFGVDSSIKYDVFTWKNLINLVNPTLKARILEFISFVPPEFKHLIS